MTNLSQLLSLLTPEISVSLFLVAIVVFDLVFNKDKRLLPYLGIAGMAVTLYYVLAQYSEVDSAIHHGMITVDKFGLYFKTIILLSSLFIILFAMSSDEIKESHDRHGEYYTLMYGMMLGMFVLISATNLILIYLSLELLSFSSYVLAGFTKLRNRSSEAALKYILYGGVSSGLMLFGISLIYGLTGTTDLYAINEVLSGSFNNVPMLALSSILVFVGIGYKISAVPFHFWTPDVYEGAPVTITAYLSVASKAAGFAMLIRILYTGFVTLSGSDGNWLLVPSFDWQTLLIVVSVLTMTLGNFTALWQDNLKRLLAYSSIAHAGYILLGIIVMSNQGLVAILIYFFFYMLMNLGAFYIVMLIANKSGSENINDYDGIGYKAPFLGVALTIFLVALTGLPPTAGFIGKFYLFVALIDAKMITIAIIAIFNSVVSLYYYVRVIKHMYLTKPTDSTTEVPSTVFNTVVTLALVIPVLVFGVYFKPIVNFAKDSLAGFGL